MVNGDGIFPKIIFLAPRADELYNVRRRHDKYPYRTYPYRDQKGTDQLKGFYSTFKGFLSR